jgi:hypothetical protein
MRPGPKKPGESAADYNARIKAMEQKFLNRPKGPKTGGGAPVRPDRPAMPSKPTTPVRPPKPRPGEPLPGRGTAAAPGYGGGKPRRMMSGGMVKGKKK